MELRGVTFRYEDHLEPALRDVDLVVEAGSTVALVGGTASGKTSLVSLLPRSATPPRARCCSTAPTCAPSSSALRSQIAFVTDDPFLFSASVHENIAYAPSASREDVQLAARRAQADRFIAELPDGYDTLIGERAAWASASASPSPGRCSPTRGC